MRKVTAIVVYSRVINNEDELVYKYICNNLPVITSDKKHITLYTDNWDAMDRKHPYKYDSFNDLYNSILNTLKYNDMYYSYYDDFNSRFYDILWIDCVNPSKIETYGYRKEK